MNAPKVVFVPGCWDLLHRGHFNLLARAYVLAHAQDKEPDQPPGLLVVSVVMDSGVRAYKGRMPVQNWQLRAQNIQRLGFVDVVEYQRTTDPTPLLERFRPDMLVHGDDWSELREGQETLARLGIEFVRLPYTPEVSTTMLRERVAS